MKTYQFDPHLSPSLQWAGKAEGTSFDVPTSSIHIHESIKPFNIIAQITKAYSEAEEDQLEGQVGLFAAETPAERMRRRREAIEFYQHGVDWTNRLIAGDSLVIMNSLLEKEGMAGQVQMVYIDPPYGIKYGSNFQPFVDKRDVKDRKDEDLTQEPEMIKAFRDTWELGIHSYLTYLRNRLLLARELLEEDGKEEFCRNNRYYHGHAEEIRDRFGEKKGYVILILDMTDTKNYIEEITRVREQAEQANIAKSAFLANMSHEIRTPMNAIVGLSDIIMEESKGRKVYEYVCDIKASAHNLLALINDILDLSKVEAGKMELVPAEYHVKSLVKEVLNMMDIVASQHGLMVESEYDMTIPCCYMGDESRIKQILVNLLNNALKFTKEGQVKIFVSGRPGEEKGTERLIFKVQDTGCGIRKEDLERIFENFKQLDSKRNRSAEGTGLGLSITRRLAELMQGTVSVESVYGKGSTFTVEIIQKITDERPLSEVPEREIKTEEPLEPFTAKDYKVLVVDDNLINRKVARSFLQTYGLEITEAESGMEAIELVHRIQFDLIFMDHMMPVMDGMEAVQRIRNDCGDNGRLPLIIALTANAMEGVRENFLANGFQDFLAKPLDRRAMHKMLLKWIPEDRRMAGGSWIENLQSNNDIFRKITIEGIDTDEVAGHYAGSLEEYNELLKLYCLDGKRKLKVLQELWEDQDYEGYGIEVHALKSASANVGAMRLSSRAKEQEKAVNRGDLAFVDSRVTKLLAEYEEQLANIEAYLQENRKQESAAVEKQEIGSKELRQEIETALSSLEDFQARECAHKIEEILAYQLEAETEETLEKVKEQLQLYEDEAAEQMLRELLEKIG